MDQANDEKQESKQTKTVVVDTNKCIGCGLCVSTCPEVFELSDEDRKSHVANADACANCNCQEALDNCPAHAISWTDGNPKS